MSRWTRPGPDLGYLVLRTHILNLATASSGHAGHSVQNRGS